MRQHICIPRSDAVGFLQNNKDFVQAVAYDESLAQRIRDALSRPQRIEVKKMFGGNGFMLNGKMLVGVWKDSLIARVGPDAYEIALLEPHVGQFDITCRPIRGWLLVEPEGATWAGMKTAFVARPGPTDVSTRPDTRFRDSAVGGTSIELGCEPD
jgi:hypothetical protein